MPWSEPLAAIACAACYFTAFLRFSRRAPQPSRLRRLGNRARNARLPPDPAHIGTTLIWSIAAILATLAGPRLRIHGALYLLAAALISGLPAILVNAFTGNVLEPAPLALWIMAVSSLCCYAAFGRTPEKVSTLSALLAALSLAALLILIGKPSLALLATVRTLITCALALAFCFLGARTGRRELVWISYVAIALGTIKLVMEDFRQSSPAALALSLLCYGALLILIPKLSAKRLPRL